MNKVKKEQLKPTQTNLGLAFHSIFWACSQGMKPVVVARNWDYIIIQDLKTKNLIVFPSADIDSEVSKIMSIGHEIRLTPSDGLKNAAFTSDLLSEWETQRRISNIVGRAFLFACLENTGVDPLEEERKTIHQSIVDIFELEAFLYRALWDLVKAGFSCIKKEFPSLPFDTPEQLTIEVIKEDRNSRFECLISNNWIQFLTDELSSLWDKDSKAAQERLVDPSKTLSKSTWLPKILNTLQRQSRKRRILKALLETYDVATTNLAEAFVEFFKARTEKGKVVTSQVWKDGEQYFFDRYNRPTISRSDYPMRYKT